MQTSCVAIPAAWFLNPAYRHALPLKGFFGRCQTQQTALPSDRALAAANIRRLFSAWPMSTLMRVLKRQDELMIACSFPRCPGLCLGDARYRHNRLYNLSSGLLENRDQSAGRGI